MKQYLIVAVASFALAATATLPSLAQESGQLRQTERNIRAQEVRSSEERGQESSESRTFSQEGRMRTQSSADGERRMTQAQVQDRVEAIRDEVRERQTQVHRDVCERRQDRLQQVVPRLATSAGVLLDNMDTLYERVQEFYDNDQLTVEGYDLLVAEVDAARSSAAIAVDATKEFEFELDCDNPGVGSQLEGFREVVLVARDSLKDYRDSLVNLISALRSESAQSGDTDTDDVNRVEEEQ